MAPAPEQTKGPPARPSPGQAHLLHGGAGVLDDPLTAGLAGDSLDVELDTDAIKKKKAEQAEQRALAEAKAKERRQISQLAGYGDPPVGLVDGVRYALRVLWRQYKLKSALGALGARHQRGKSQVDGALGAVGRALYACPQIQQLEACREAIQAVRLAESEIRETAAAQEHARASVVEQMRDVMQAIRETQALAAPIRAREAPLLDELRKYEGLRAQHQALIDKAEAEYRTLMQGMAGTPDPGWVASVETQRRARQAKLDAVSAKIAQVGQKLEQVRSELQENQAAVDALHEQRKAFHGVKARDDEQFAAKRQTASQTKQAAFANLGRIGLELNLTEQAGKQIAEARDAIAALEVIRRQMAVHQKALGGYSSEAFRRGLTTVGAFAVLVLVVVAALALVLAHVDIRATQGEKVGQDVSVLSGPQDSLASLCNQPPGVRVEEVGPSVLYSKKGRFRSPSPMARRVSGNGGSNQ